MSNSESGFIKRPYTEVEFQQKIETIRHDVSTKMNKWADRIQVSMAFTPTVERVEHERWSENGKTWVIKNGVKQSVSILEEARMPIWCPRCSTPMNHRFDRKFYFLRGWCFNCNVDVEGQMRVDGTYDAYEQRILRENEKSYLKDKIQERLEYMRTFKLPQVHFEDGRWENLASLQDFSGLFTSLEEDIEKLTTRLEEIIQEEQGE